MKKIFFFLNGLALISNAVLSQNVGIGITAPQSQLHVGANSTNELIIGRDKNTGGYTALNLGTSALSNGYGYRQAIQSAGSTWGNLILSPIGGNTGIGIAAPQFKLDVNGRMSLRTSIFGNPGATPGTWLDDYRNGNFVVFAGMKDSIRYGLFGATAGWKFNFNSNTGYVGINRDAGNDWLEINQTTPNRAISFYMSNDLSGSLRSTDSTFEINAAYGFIPNALPPKDLILLPPAADPTRNNIGKVCIGINKPASGYLLSVAGKIISEEVRVELKTAWPDYVFNKNYRLMPLPELEKFLQYNKHLPGIPAAIVVERQGFELGDMNKRLLEKVEELTLYIIEQNKRIEVLEKKIINPLK